MNCEIVREQLGAWCDGQLEPPEAAAVDSHLATCAECRAEGRALGEQDAQLKRVLRPQRLAANRVAAGVIQRLKIEPAVPPHKIARTSSSWGSLLVAAAAGFLLAVVVFQPWKHRLQVVNNIPINPEVVTPQVTAPRVTVAQLVVSTGAIEVRQPGEEAWQPSSGIAAFQCPSGSAVRTGANVQCELKTQNGGVVRLNEETEVKLAAGDRIEIESGQIWCSTPDDQVMNVVAPAGASRSDPPNSAWSMACPSDSCIQTAIGRNGTQVMTSAGEIELQTPTARRKLKPGESVSIVKGAIVEDERAADPLLSARWTQPLLIRKGYDNRELNTYVEQLLAGARQSKLAILYEQDIRSLGEYAALPLIRYVQSPLSQNDPPQRKVAIRLVADLVPNWAIGDLVKLLGDSDAETRFLAAHTLQRLTGLDQGRTPEAWREDLTDCQGAIDRWRMWWAENQNRYPPPVTSRSPV